MATTMTVVDVDGAMPTSTTSPLPQWELSSDPRSQSLPVVVGDLNENTPRSSTATTSASSNEKTAYNRGGEAATSIVVCGVDGTVYTLDAYTGHLRGMFASGPALFEPSAEEEDGQHADGGGDDSDNSKTAITSNLSSSTSKERILPGLNGYLYKISENTMDNGDDADDQEQAIQELFPAKDVVDFPISACPENASTDDKQQQQEGCGVIIGSKQTTIFALDPTTGKVRWTQDPHGGAGGRGFTAHPPKANAARGRTVLLQREDYAVRHLDADRGHEVWKIKLGQFSPLGFDVDDESMNGNDFLFTSESSAAALTFGQDGPSLMAADRISGEVLWSRRIDSDIAAIYGIGKDRRWVSLETFDVPSDRYLGLDRTPPKNVVGVSTSVSEGIIPFGARNMESHRIGRHGSHSYVITKFDVGRNQFQLPSPDNIHNTLSNPGSRQLVAQHGRDHGIYKADDHLASTKPNLSSMSTLKRIEGLIPFGARQVESRNQLHRLGGHDSLVLINSPNMNNPDFHRSMQVAHGYHAAENLFPLKPVVDMSMIGVRPLPSHRTEHGLYLTWSMVSAVVIILLSVIVFFARLIILRQKRKWENISKLNQSAAASSEGGIRDGERIQPLQAQTLNTPSLGSVNGRSKKYLPVARSFSLGAIRTHSFSTRPMLTERGNSDLNGDSSTLPGASTPAMSPNTEKSKANSTDAILLDDKSRPGIDNIDGIPLVRYSRYTSEFKEILALGRGGFGTVFRCRNVLDGREYAIKKIRIASPLNSGDVTKHLSQKLHRVLREVKCLALLDHPNIVRYYTAWLEVDNGVHGDDDETNTISSMFDRSTLVSGFESFSRAMQQSFLPKRSKFQRPTEGRKDPSNPLGWNNFGSLRFEESKSESSTSLGARVADATKAVSIDDEEDDLGFTWERSKDNSAEQLLSVEKQPLEKLEVEGRHSSAISDCLENENDGAPSPLSRPATQLRSEAEKAAQLPQARCNGKASVGRHILFIQMQLCGVQTLADFLANHEARGGVVSQSSSDDSRYAVDVPFAIRLFAQIAHGVKYVHKQGLIHRDLKPQNCFIDDTGIVKVGDFGLSRESSAASGIPNFDENDKDSLVGNDSFSSLNRSDAENTAGVGTRAYASPEQMRGSNYDASTDVFSLGLILFELCYPMYTSMERYQEFSGIQKGCFPAYWVSHVQPSFPTLHDLLVQMISEKATERPSADAVSDHIDSLLREHSMESLDKSWGDYFYALELLERSRLQPAGTNHKIE